MVFVKMITFCLSMNLRSFIFQLLIFSCLSNGLYAQDDSKLKFVSYKKSNYDPLRPAKASFYSAVLPGLGQIYNKKYWKVPIIYGALGVSTYFYIDSNKKYNIYRDEYKRRLEGYGNKIDLTSQQLILAQKTYQRNRDFSALFIVGFYILNIIDANVDASISQFNVNENLSLNAEILKTDLNICSDFGVKLTYHF